MLQKLLPDAERRPAILRVLRALLRYDRERLSRDVQTLVELLHAGHKQDTLASAMLRRDILAILAQELEGNTPLKVVLSARTTFEEEKEPHILCVAGCLSRIWRVYGAHHIPCFARGQIEQCRDG